MEKGILKNVTKFTVKHLFHSLFFNKVANPACVLSEIRDVEDLWQQISQPYHKNNSSSLSKLTVETENDVNDVVFSSFILVN